MFGMFNRGEKKSNGRRVKRVRFDDLPLRVDLPQPKGEFRNMFEDVVEQVRDSKRGVSGKPDAPKSE